MKRGGKEFRASNYDELILRNIKKPKKLESIKKKVQMIFSILACGLGYSVVSEFCEYNDFPIISESMFYDYLHFFDQKLDALSNEQFIVGFDAGWAHKRNANQCIGVLMDLLTGLIISFQIIYHGPENSENITSTQVHSKSFEKIALEKILNKIQISDEIKMIFVHDSDISADSIVSKKYPFCDIKYDPNHYVKTQKSIIDSYCSEDKLLKKFNEKIKNFYSDLMHDTEKNIEIKMEKWKNMVNCFITNQNWSEKENSDTIQNLKNLIDELSESFSKIDPLYTTNGCESFNHSRAMLANKDIAWRLTWRIRAFISIIRWNCDNWVEVILNEFQIFNINDSIAKRKKMVRKNKRIIEKTTKYKKERAIYIKNKKNKYVAKKKR